MKDMNRYLTEEDTQVANAHEKLFNIISHEGKANQYQSPSLHIEQKWLRLKKQRATTPYADKDVETQITHTLLVQILHNTAILEKSASFAMSQTCNNHTNSPPALLSTHQRSENRHKCTASSIRVKTTNSPKVLSNVTDHTNCGTHIHKLHSSLKHIASTIHTVTNS